MRRFEAALQKRNGEALVGLAVHAYDPVFVEIVARLGFDALWIEMEHTAITFSEAGDLSRMASGLGLLVMIRIPSASRENILKAAELNPDILDVPMVNTPEIAFELVRHARYPPAGERGFFSVSRAMQYGLARSIREEQVRINEELGLMIQIETKEAVDRAEELCAIPEIGGVFLGPGDLSMSLGVPGETRHQNVVAAIEKTVKIARAKHKHVALACAPGEVLDWAKKGVDLLFCGGNTGCLRAGAEGIMEKVASDRRMPRIF